MSDGKWSGGAANRTWARPGSRYFQRDPAADRALSASMAHVEFWCETCGRMHPLAEHQACRSVEVAHWRPQ